MTGMTGYFVFRIFAPAGEAAGVAAVAGYLAFCFFAKESGPAYLRMAVWAAQRPKGLSSRPQG
jgi:hypothetical protein